MLEINAAPLFKKFDDIGAYPERDIMELAKDYKIRCVYGSDAHVTRCVGYGYDLLRQDKSYKNYF